MSDEEYVRSRWERVECIGYDGQRFVSINDDMWASSWSTDAEAWQAAAEFTRQREEEIRLVEEKIAVIGKVCAVFPFYPDRCERVVNRYEQILAELKRGMKESR